MKKVPNTDFEGDIWKLKGMTEQVGDYYVDAELDEELTEWMGLTLEGED